MPQMDTVGSHKTTVRGNGQDALSVVYHSTEIVNVQIYDGRTVTLNTDGYKSVTTKTRMNQASAQYGLGYHVYQKKGLWYVTLDNGTVLDFFNDQISFKI